MPKVILNGIELFYNREGSGPRTFLLFNGARCEIGSWGDLATELGKIGEVLRFDYRDVGRTAVAKESYTLETLSEDASALLKHLGIDRTIVVGHAFGGRVAQVFIRDNPGKASALILCGTGGQFPPNLPKIDTSSAKVGEKMSGADRFLVTFCGSKFPIQYPERAQKLFEELRAQTTSPGSNERLTQAIQATPSDTYWGKMPVSVPVLLIYGTEDRFGTPENARDLNQRLEGSRLVFLEGAGHFAIREETDRVFEEIQKFVRDKAL